MIWLPWPLKVPLGVASPVWIVTNAALGIWFALKFSPEKRKVVIGLMLLVVLAYAVLNESATFPFVVFGILVSLVVMFHRYRKRKMLSHSTLIDEACSSALRPASIILDFDVRVRICLSALASEPNLM